MRECPLSESDVGLLTAATSNEDDEDLGTEVVAGPDDNTALLMARHVKQDFVWKGKVQELQGVVGALNAEVARLKGDLLNSDAGVEDPTGDGELDPLSPSPPMPQASTPKQPGFRRPARKG
jgi:uncharacterized small protein (DUF1192 family)